jgi:hypothetical protein
MTGFTITITPTPTDDPAAHTSIHVDTGAGGARITEMTVRAADGGTLTPQYLAGVDLEALIAALSPPASAATTTARPAPPDTGPTRAQGRATGRTNASATTPSRARQAKKDTSAAGQRSDGQRSAGRRAYRRMPEAREVLDAYRKLGGTTALARHFGVPRHTATGWLRRLRRTGQLD